MRNLLFATNNLHKLAEIRQILGDVYHIYSLDDIGFKGEIPETEKTLEGNALQKARFIYDKYKTDCFADDTGLEIDALGGAPGVYSARFAGEKVTYQQNRDKVRRLLAGVEKRGARFRTVIALIMEGKEFLFEGVINGVITNDERGEGGFGYDAIFLPDGFDFTFAQMPPELKNKISHRGLAVQKLITHLKSL
ncbi:MAG: Non-canonical purine NTP pyrophosphatase [Bacteroidetes bacterium ADurb.Bin408]|nr:MAG: Non-canonical purine NTP pyrophosphatase [Bacteroidetes bacterium ADurb.Bin408]